MNPLPIHEISENVQRDLEQAGAIWTYDGSPNSSMPHALLTSGQHSDGFANVGQFLKDFPEKRLALANLLLAHLKTEWQESFTRVVGADTSSTELANDIARIAGVKHIRMVKTELNGEKLQVFHENNEPLLDGDVILQVEELITTGSSPSSVRGGIFRKNHGKNISFVPFLPVIVDRSNPEKRIQAIGPSRILPLLQLNIRNYDPKDCPYCKVGSEAIKPKEGNNWSRLTGK